MAKYTYRCACGTTTTTTEKDAIKQVSQKAGVVPNYNPLGKKNGKKKKESVTLVTTRCHVTLNFLRVCFKRVS